MPQSVRLVLNAELCASLAAHDPADAAISELPLLLQQAFQDALSDRCVGFHLNNAIMAVLVSCCYLRFHVCMAIAQNEKRPFNTSDS